MMSISRFNSTKVKWLSDKFISDLKKVALCYDKLPTQKKNFMHCVYSQLDNSYLLLMKKRLLIFFKLQNRSFINNFLSVYSSQSFVLLLLVFTGHY